MKKILYMMIVLLLASCSQEDVDITDYGNNLVGSWTTDYAVKTTVLNGVKTEIVYSSDNYTMKEITFYDNGTCSGNGVGYLNVENGFVPSYTRYSLIDDILVLYGEDDESSYSAKYKIKSMTRSNCVLYQRYENYRLNDVLYDVVQYECYLNRINH